MAGEEPGSLFPLPPPAVTGLVVSRADLAAALRAYIPQLVDVTSLDGERFLLSLSPTEPAE